MEALERPARAAPGESAAVFGAIDKPGPYAILVRWHPGYMSAPHTYVTDRLCFVISGTWWVNSGENFEPENTVPVPAGGFVRRVAHTPHYDGVKKGGKEPAVIGIFGQAPIELKSSIRVSRRYGRCRRISRSTYGLQRTSHLTRHSLDSLLISVTYTITSLMEGAFPEGMPEKRSGGGACGGFAIRSRPALSHRSTGVTTGLQAR